MEERNSRTAAGQMLTFLTQHFTWLACVAALPEFALTAAAAMPRTASQIVTRQDGLDVAGLVKGYGFKNMSKPNIGPLVRFVSFIKSDHILIRFVKAEGAWTFKAGLRSSLGGAPNSLAICPRINKTTSVF
jgi:hypothetical protein